MLTLTFAVYKTLVSTSFKNFTDRLQIKLFEGLSEEGILYNFFLH